MTGRHVMAEWGHDCRRKIQKLREGGSVSIVENQDRLAPGRKGIKNRLDMEEMMQR